MQEIRYKVVSDSSAGVFISVVELGLDRFRRRICKQRFGVAHSSALVFLATYLRTLLQAFELNENRHYSRDDYLHCSECLRIRRTGIRR